MRLTHAIWFFDRGVEIAICQPRSKAFLAGYGPYKQHAQDDRELYKRLVGQDCNYALLTGTGAGDLGLVVLDFDDRGAFSEWQEAIGVLGDTFTVETSRGYHVYYWSNDVRSWKARGVEVKGANQAIMGPFCIHPSGKIYEPNFRDILEIETVSDFPLLSDSRPELPQAPEKAPGRLSGDGDTVGRIKRAWPILDGFHALRSDPRIARTIGSIKGEGRWRRALCPFHDDHKRSFWIDTERNLFGCHACDNRGDVINLYARILGMPNRDAIKELARGLDSRKRGARA
jgi:hypothetical protein